VLAIDPEKRQIKLSMKQLIPTGIDEYIAEHKVGDQVSGRVVEASPEFIQVELGDGIRAVCRAAAAPAGQAVAPAATEAKPGGKLDLSSLSSQLKNRWKGNSPAASAKPEALSPDQIRTFKIVKLDAGSQEDRGRVGVGQAILRHFHSFCRGQRRAIPP
jgi:small subunit ribosomal protein S1